MRNIIQNLGLIDLEFYLDAFGFTFIFTQEDHIDRRYEVINFILENMYGNNNFSMLLASNNPNITQDRQGGLFSIKRYNDYVPYRFNTQEIIIAIEPYNIIICRADVPHFLHLFQNKQPHILTNRNWEITRVLFHYNKDNPIVHIPTHVVFNCLREMDTLRYLRTIKNGQNIPLTQEMHVELDNKINNFHQLLLPNKFINQLDYTLEAGIIQQNQLVVPEYKWIKNHPDRHRFKNIRYNKFDIYVSNIKIPQVSPFRLHGGISIMPVNSDEDHEHEHIQGLGIFSKHRYYSKTFHYVKQKHHLVPKLRNERIEEQTIQQVRRNIDTMDMLFNSLRDHPIKQKLYKYRMEFSFRSTGESIAIMAERSQNKTLSFIINEICYHFSQTLPKLGISIISNSNDLPKLHFIHQNYLLYQKELRKMLVGKNESTMSTLPPAKILCYRFLWANCMISIGFTSNKFRSMIGRFLRPDRQPFTYKRAFYDAFLADMITRSSDYFDSFMLPLDNVIINQVLLSDEDDVNANDNANNNQNANDTVENNNNNNCDNNNNVNVDNNDNDHNDDNDDNEDDFSLINLSNYPQDSLPYFHYISRVLHFHYQSKESVKTFLAENRFHPNHVRKPTRDQIRKVLLHFGLSGTVDNKRKRKDLVDRFEDLLPNIIYMSLNNNENLIHTSEEYYEINPVNQQDNNVSEAQNANQQVNDINEEEIMNENNDVYHF